jgi:hypothetical protein
MGLGECIHEDFLLIAENPTQPSGYVIPSTSTECCFLLNVLAETSITNALRNDKSDFIKFYGNSFTSVVLTLQKYDNGTWNDVKILNNNDVGTFYPFGFFTNSFNEKAIGFLIDWQKVLTFAGLGEGSYRIKTADNNAIAPVQNQYSFEYCLKTWNQYREDNTIKIEWNMNALVGDPMNDTKQRDFGTQNRYNQIRLEGDFGRDTTPFESEYVHYQSGSSGYGKEVWVKNKFFDSFLLSLYPLPYYIHQFLKHDVMLGDDIRISDFNTLNPINHIQRYVKASGNYEPVWNFGSKYASVELKFDQLYQNNQHKRC